MSTPNAVILSTADDVHALSVLHRLEELGGTGVIVDLAEAVNEGEELTFALNAEFYAREDGWRPLQQAYDFRVSRGDVKRMDSGLVYPALRDGDVEVGLVFATDGRIPAFDFRVLEDDKGYFPAYALTPVVREETLEENPELAEQMNTLSALLDDETMAELNARVDVERENIEDVSKRFLEENDLL